MKNLFIIFVVILFYQYSYSKSENSENNNFNILKSNADTSKTILDTNNIIQKSDLGINLLVSSNVFFLPSFTYRKYLTSFFVIEIGFFPTPYSLGLKYGASLNYNWLIVSLVNYHILNDVVSNKDIINSIYIGYNPVNTGNLIDFNFKLGILGYIFTKNKQEIGPGIEIGLKYNFYK